MRRARRRAGRPRSAASARAGGRPGAGPRGHERVEGRCGEGAAEGVDWSAASPARSSTRSPWSAPARRAAAGKKMPRRGPAGRTRPDDGSAPRAGTHPPDDDDQTRAPAGQGRPDGGDGGGAACRRRGRTSPRGPLRGAAARGARAGVDAVAVVSRDDAWPLRAALLVRHLDAEVPIVATIFDPAAGAELEQEIGNCTITSLADIVAPTLAGPCLDDDLAAVIIDGDTSGRSDCAAATAVRAGAARDRRAPAARAPHAPSSSRSTAARRWSSSARSGSC